MHVAAALLLAVTQRTPSRSPGLSSTRIVQGIGVRNAELFGIAATSRGSVARSGASSTELGRRRP